eukprot:CAMPEP_0114142976 /NCGR_PEP_ID=MMETSP0043_2-20121206/18735_1 /TAXON_ID=464988 /ORGANISM="Hemiselmis andersenii, Strain CCMP644" /LENGTH=362 /DNA_ID=CAMNT_0001237233 /DNA_START=128 /DNA_END=1214 /DNA_ORIENTATION=+
MQSQAIDSDVALALRKNAEMKELLSRGPRGRHSIGGPPLHPSGLAQVSGRSPSPERMVEQLAVPVPVPVPEKEVVTVFKSSEEDQQTIKELKTTVENLIKDLGRALLEKQRCEAEIESARKKYSMLQTAMELRTASEEAAAADAEHCRKELALLLEDRQSVDEAQRAQAAKQQQGIAELRKTFLEEMEKLEQEKKAQMAEFEKSYSTALREAQKRMTDARESEAGASKRAERAEQALREAKEGLGGRLAECEESNRALAEQGQRHVAALQAQQREIEALRQQLEAEGGRAKTRIEGNEKALREADEKVMSLEGQLRFRDKEARAAQRDLVEAETRIREVRAEMETRELAHESKENERMRSLA